MRPSLSQNLTVHPVRLGWTTWFRQSRTAFTICWTKNTHNTQTHTKRIQKAYLPITNGPPKKRRIPNLSPKKCHPLTRPKKHQNHLQMRRNRGKMLSTTRLATEAPFRCHGAFAEGAASIAGAAASRCPPGEPFEKRTGRVRLGLCFWLMVGDVDLVDASVCAMLNM